eukprot:gene7958-biopygen9121
MWWRSVRGAAMARRTALTAPMGRSSGAAGRRTGRGRLLARCTGSGGWGERRPPSISSALGETAEDVSGTRPARVRFFKLYRVGRVRDASAAVSPCCGKAAGMGGPARRAAPTAPSERSSGTAGRPQDSATWHHGRDRATPRHSAPPKTKQIL